MNHKYKYFKTSIFLLVITIVATLSISIVNQTKRTNSQECIFEKKECLDLPKYFPDVKTGWRALYDLPQDSPARFALNNIASRNSWRAFRLLNGKWPGTDADRETSAETIKKLGKSIELGLTWPHKIPPTFEIPYTKTAPLIDGYLNDACWNKALSFKGAYPVDSVKKENDGSIWKMMWDWKYFYAAAYFPDKHILASTSRKHPYYGDSIEIFLMPSKRMKKYWEIIIGCNGDFYDGFHCNNRHGGWASDHLAKMRGVRFKVLKQKTGYSIEVAIPFLELPNYMLGNQPLAGQTIHFAIVRTNKTRKDGEVEYSSVFPLLYGGYNIFGLAKGILKK